HGLDHVTSANAFDRAQADGEYCRREIRRLEAALGELDVADEIVRRRRAEDGPGHDERVAPAGADADEAAHDVGAGELGDTRGHTYLRLAPRRNAQAAR